jgi:F-type H+-transporting ATPase subunit a
MLHISLKAEKLLTLYGIPVTNSLFLSSIVFVFFIILALYYYFQVRKNGEKSRFFYLFNFSLRFIYGLFKSVFGDKINYFFPLLGTFFFFILIHNWSGLVPGVGSILFTIGEGIHRETVPLLRGATTDLNTTLALALITVIFSQFIGIKTLGFFNYLGKFFSFKSPVMFFAGIIEAISEISRLIAYSFRLFGNIFAGEVIIGIMAFLLPVLVSFPFLLFEIFIGFIQAVVFSMLSAVFYNLSMQKAEH